MYDLLGHRQKYREYRVYAEAGFDADLKDFFPRERTDGVMGDAAFLTCVQERQLQEVEDQVFVRQVLPNTVALPRITQLVADYYKVETTNLTSVVKGSKKRLLTCNVARYLC